MRFPLPAAVVLAAMVAVAPAADGGTLMTCRGQLAFADALARAVTMSVDVERGFVRLPDCTKYPELPGFCEAHIMAAKSHRFVFAEIAGLEDSKVRLVLHRTSPAVSTDVVLIERPKAVFLGRCEPARAKARHRKHA